MTASKTHPGEQNAPQNARLWARIQQRFIEPSPEVEGTVNRHKARFLALLLGAFVLLTGVRILIGVISGTIISDPVSNFLILFFFCLLVLYRLSRTQHYEIAATIAVLAFLTLFFVMAIIRWTFNNEHTAERLFGTMVWSVLPLLLGSYFFSFRKAVNLVTVLNLTLLLLPLLIPGMTYNTILSTFGFLFNVSVLTLTITYYRRQLDIERQTFFETTNHELQILSGLLENRINDRTRALATSAEVSRILATHLDIQEVIMGVVNLLQSAFHYYHVHIYLFDETNEYLVMEGGAGQTGQTILVAGHKLTPNQGIVGQAATTNKPILVANVLQDPNWLPHPLLPDTKAEAAIPIAVGNQVLGILDVQHNSINGLTPEDVDLFQSIADQMAVAVQNAQRYQRLQEQAVAFQETNNFLDTIIENFPLGVSVKDAQELRIIHWNPANTALLGLSREEVMGKHDYDLFPPATAAHFISQDKEVLNTETAAVVQEIVDTFHQGPRLLHTIKVPIMDAQGQPKYLLAISEDVTERKGAEDALRESEEKYRTILESIQDGYFETDLQGDHLFCNSQYAQVFGYTPEEFNNMNYRDFTQPNITPTVYKVFNQVYQTGVPCESFVYPAVKKDGSIGYVELSISLIKDEHENPFGFRGLARDVDERVRVHEALRTSEERYRNIIESIKDGYYEVDLKGTVTFCNNRLAQILGYQRGEDVYGVNNRSFTTEETANQVYEVFNSVYRTGEPISGFVWPIIRADGSTRYIETSTALIKDKQGEAIGFCGITRDITVRRYQEASIRGQAAENRVLYEVSQHLTTAAHLEEILQKLLTTLQKHSFALDVDHITFITIEVDQTEESTQGKLMAVWRLDEAEHPIPVDTSYTLSDSPLLQHCLQNPSQPIFIADLAADERFSHETDGDLLPQHLPASIIIPLHIANRWIGIVTIHWAEPQEFSEQEKRIYHTLRIPIASALENQSLFLQTKAQLTETRILYEATQVINQATSVYQALASLMQVLSEYKIAIDVDSAILSNIIVDKEGNPTWAELSVWWAANEREPSYPMGTRFPLEEFVTAPLWIQDPFTPLFFANVQMDPRLDEISRQIYIKSGIYASVSLPLKLGNRWVGLVSISWKKPQTFSELAQRIYQMLIERLATLVNNRQLFAQTQKALAHTEQLYEMSTKLNTIKSIEDILPIAVIPAFYEGVTTASLFIIDVDANGRPEWSRIIASWHHPERGPADPPPVGAQFYLPDYPNSAQWIDNPQQPWMRGDVINDETVDPATKEIYRKTNIAATVLLPLRIGSTWVGLLGVSWDTPQNFTDDDERLYKSLAEQTAAMLNTQLLFEQTQKRATELAIVAEVSAAISTILEVDELLQTVAALTKEQFHLYHTHIYLLNEMGNSLIFAAGAGAIEQEMSAEGQVIPLDQSRSVIARAARTCQGVIVNDMQTDPLFSPPELLPDSRSEIAVPLVLGDRVLGAIAFHASEANHFAEDDIRIMSSLAAQIAIALENARSFERSEKARHELDLITQRLTREAWEVYFQDTLSSDMNFTYQPRMTAVSEAESENHQTDITLTRPLLIQGEAVGQLVMADPKALTDEATDIINEIAERLSIHIENLRLSQRTQLALAETEEQARRLTLLNEMSAELNMATTLPQIYDIAVANTSQMLPVHQITLTLLTPEKDHLQIMAVYGEAVDSDALLLPGSPMEKAIQETRLVQDKGPDNNQSILIAPLSVSGQVIGTLNIRHEEPDTYHNSEENLLLQIASLVSNRIENMQLLTDAQMRADRERQVRTITDKIRRAPNRETILQVAREEISRMLGASKSSVRLGTQAQLLTITKPDPTHTEVEE